MGHSAGFFIKSQRVAGRGLSFQSINPASGGIVWEGNSASREDVDSAVAAAREAAVSWGRLGIVAREAFLRRFATLLLTGKEALARTISMEMGKPLWESKSEVDLVIKKVDLAVRAIGERTPTQEMLRESRRVVLSHRPHGVVAVLSPYNFPIHLAMGHIIPALLAGNSVVWKPSDEVPWTSIQMMNLWAEAGLPDGVFNLVQGGALVGEWVSEHPDVRSVLFTGGVGGGLALMKHAITRPDQLIVTEMGGNNPLVVSSVGHLESAARMIVQSAFITSGQRCTCARRLIAIDSPQNRQLLDAVKAAESKVKVGVFDDAIEPFMGPVVSQSRFISLKATYDHWCSVGGVPIVAFLELDPGRPLMRPVIVDMTSADREDVETFGPMLQWIWVPDFEAALREANATRFGLAASLLSDDKEEFERFLSEIRAGVINWNVPTTGALSELPFGGVGLSGNHRPSGYYAADYCSYPVASVLEPIIPPPGPLPGFP